MAPRSLLFVCYPRNDVNPHGAIARRLDPIKSRDTPAIPRPTSRHWSRRSDPATRRLAEVPPL